MGLECVVVRVLHVQTPGNAALWPGEKLGLRTLIKDIAQGSIHTEMWRSQANIRLCKRDHKK